MFFEKLGRFLFRSIRPSFFYGLTMVPLLLAGLSLFFQYQELLDLQGNFQESLKETRPLLERKKLQTRFLQRYTPQDPDRLEQMIEAVPLLQKEVTQLQNASTHPAVQNREEIKERLRFLQSENQLTFVEDQIRRSSQVKETEEKQRHPVQVDEKDLFILLSLIEDLKIEPCLPTRPQLLIEQFHLRLEKTPLQTEVFSIEMNLLKREFTS